MNNKLSGLDEAGKGALVGPMIVACATVTSTNSNYVSRLRELGVTDSKLVSTKKRKEILSAISLDSSFKLSYLEISTVVIDQYVSENKLNELLYESYLSLMKKNDSAYYYLDAFISPITLRRRLKRDITTDSELIVEYKGDLLYYITGLASLYAKQKREESIDNLGLRKKVRSGYPSDPICKEYIRKNYTSYLDKTLKEIRYSWKIKI